MSSYRPRSPPRRHLDPRASTGSNVYSVPYDSRAPRYDRQYVQPIARRTYVDDGYGGGASTRTDYTVRPRGNSLIEPEYRRSSSVNPAGPMSPPKRPVVMSTQYDRPKSPTRRLEPPRESDRFLQPAGSNSGRHHHRHHSATPADMERLVVARGDGGRDRAQYYRPPPSSTKNYPSSRAPLMNSEDEGFSYTGPREQFARDMQRRDQARRERPMSVIEIPSAESAARRDLGPPSASSRHFDRMDRLEPPRSSLRGAGDSDQERRSDLPRRHHSVRNPVVHQPRDDRYLAPRDDNDDRRTHRSREYADDRDYRKSQDPGRYPDRNPERELDTSRRRDDDRRRPRDRENSLEGPYLKGPPLRPDDARRPPRSHESSPERVHRSSVSKGGSDPRRKPRSREGSPDRSGVGQGLAAAGLGSLAGAGLANGLSKSRDRPEESDEEARKERRRRRYKDDERDRDEGASRRTKDVDQGDDDNLGQSRRDRNGEKGLSDSQDEHHRPRHHRRRRRHHDEEDTGAEHPSESGSDRPGAVAPRNARRERRDEESESDRPKLLEDGPHDPAAGDPRGGPPRTILPGDDENERPRRVQLVEPGKEDDPGNRPRGILKPPRTQPFPEDPNPVREGVAPLKGPGKDLPPDARWTKINRVLVNPEALRRANERFEEFEEYVIVLRVLSKEDVHKLAVSTQEIRDEREREWQEELANNPRPRKHRGRHDDDEDEDDNRRPPPPAILAPPQQAPTQAHLPPPPPLPAAAPYPPQDPVVPPPPTPPQAAPVDPHVSHGSQDPLGRSNPGQPVVPIVNIVPETYSEHV